MKEKFLAQYFQLIKTFLKSKFSNTDGYTNAKSIEWKKWSFGGIWDELIQFSYKIDP